MTYYLAKHDNVPFYKAGDKFTRADWMQKLHLDESQFEELISANCGDFHEMETTVTIEVANRIGDGNFIYLQRKGGLITAAEVELLRKEITPILEKFNSRSDFKG